MAEGWTRRQILAQATIAAAVYTLDPHELCCGVKAHAQTAGSDVFELKRRSATACGQRWQPHGTR